MIHTAHEIKQEYEDVPELPSLHDTQVPTYLHELPTVHPLLLCIEVRSFHSNYFLQFYREMNNAENLAAIPFPEDDLTKLLLSLFFRYVTPFLPLIHRVSFEAQFADRLHERDSHQAFLLNMICSVASIFCSDPRVFGEIGGHRIPGITFYREALKFLYCSGVVSLASLQGYTVCIVSSCSLFSLLLF